MLANTGPKGLPITTPSNCSYIWLLKLNSIPRVAISINSLKVFSGNGGQSRPHRYKASAQIARREVELRNLGQIHNLPMPFDQIFALTSQQRVSKLHSMASSIPWNSKASFSVLEYYLHIGDNNLN